VIIQPSEAAMELLARRKARESFIDFCRYRLPPELKMAKHHLVMAAALDSVERGETKKLAIMLPPGSGKSFYASVLFSEYFLGRNPQLSMVAASHTAELAERFGRRVRNAYADETHRSLFNNGVAEDNSAAGRWETTAGGEYYAVGVGGSVTGRRADCVIVDDFVRSREDADSERIRAKTWDWYINDLTTRLKPDGRIVIACTRWHEQDLLGEILDRERSEWKVLKIPFLAGHNDILGRKEGERLWPEWYTDEMERQAQVDPRAFISLWQQEPRPIDGAEFKRSWINRYASPPRILNKVLLVDPAGDPAKATARRKKSDFTAMWVVGLASDNNAYVVDGLRDRLNLTQRADAVFELHRKHKPMQTRYEQYGLQADIEHIKSEMEKRQYRFAIKEVGGQVEKNARIRRLVPWFEGGRLWLPHEMTRTTVMGGTYDVVKDFIEQEFVTFPVGRNDDSFDCLARLAEPGLTLPFPDEGLYDDPKMAATWGILDSEVTGY
jgi:predicted phage terminase large subunit-like protein